jgi:hypothetical protein
MRPTSSERETGHVSPHDLVEAQRFESIERGAQTIHSIGSGGTRVYNLPQHDYDSLAEPLVTREAVAQVEPAFAGVASYSMDRGWWRDCDPGDVEARIARFPTPLVEHTYTEVADALRAAVRRWNGAVRANGSGAAARDEGFLPPDDDPDVRHVRSILQVLQTEMRKR